MNNRDESLVGDCDPILIVDDSLTARTAMRKQLEQEGYSVVEAGTGREALELLHKEAVSLITLDVEMPGIDGYETCRLMQHQEYARYQDDAQCGIPIIFITSRDSLAERIRGFEAGACDFLQKKLIRGSEFLEAIDRYLRPTKLYEDCRVLVVEDGKMVRFMLDRCIHSLGATPIECVDGHEAFELLSTDTTGFDLMILDNHMPRMGGIELCTKVRRELGLKDVPVLFLTGSDDPEDRISFFKAGGSDYILKPFIREELEARIRVQLKNSHNVRQLAELKFMLDTECQK